MGTVGASNASCAEAVPGRLATAVGSRKPRKGPGHTKRRRPRGGQPLGRLALHRVSEVVGDDLTIALLPLKARSLEYGLFYRNSVVVRNY